MNKEISLLTLWEVFLQSWKKMLIFALIAMLAMGLFTHFAIAKQYSSSVEFHVVNKAPNSDYVTNSIVSVGEYLANTYVDIIKSDVVMNDISQRLKEDWNIQYSSSALKRMISSSVPSDSLVFTVKVTSTNDYHAYLIAQLIEKHAPDIIKNVTKGDMLDATECITTINHPVRAQTHDSPSLATNAILAGVVVVILVYIIYLVKSMLSRIVKSEEDIKELIAKYPLLSSIPVWE